MLLAACGPSGSGPEAVCEREANNDPDVSRMTQVGLANPGMVMGLQDDIRIARDRARRACLQRMGVIPAVGGVEAPRQPRSMFDGFR